jgi:hypothetical protein
MWLLIVCGSFTLTGCASDAGASSLLVTEAQCRAAVEFFRRKSTVCISPDGTVIVAKK